MRCIVYLFLILCSQFSLASNPRIVFRVSDETPIEVKSHGGFIPDGFDPTRPPADISLYDHTNYYSVHTHGGELRHSGYIGTSADRETSLRRVNDPPTSGNGYIYHIRAITSFVDVNATLGQFSPFPNEHEIAALGIIRWDQIIGWEQFIGGVPRPFVANLDYRANMWGTLESSGAQYQLAGFPPNHIAWSMDPWRNFANCGGQKKSGCYPKKPAQRAGEEFFWSGYRKEVGMWLTVIETPED